MQSSRIKEKMQERQFIPTQQISIFPTSTDEQNRHKSTEDGICDGSFLVLKHVSGNVCGMRD